MANKKDFINKLKKLEDINKSNEKHIQQSRCEIGELKKVSELKKKR